MKLSREVWSTMAEKAFSPHEVRLTLLNTNPIFQCVNDISISVATVLMTTTSVSVKIGKSNTIYHIFIFK